MHYRRRDKWIQHEYLWEIAFTFSYWALNSTFTASQKSISVTLADFSFNSKRPAFSRPSHLQRYLAKICVCRLTTHGIRLGSKTEWSPNWTVIARHIWYQWRLLWVHNSFGQYTILGWNPFPVSANPHPSSLPPVVEASLFVLKYVNKSNETPDMLLTAFCWKCPGVCE